MKQRSSVLLSVGMGAALITAGLGLGLGSNAAAQGLPPIRVGAISSLTGPATFPESTQAAKAYFDRVNAQGGIKGRKIEYVVEDDRGDPSSATQAARRLVDDQNVVANVGSASILECSANSAFYVQRGLISVSGTGVDPQCFTTPNISPVNTGPYVGLGVMAYYASNVLKKQHVCAVFLQLPGTEPQYRSVIGDWERLSGKKMALVDFGFKGTDDPTPFVLRASRANCDAVIFTGVEPMVVAWMNAVKAQGLINKAAWLFLTPPYTASAAKALGSNGNGILVGSEFEPWSGNAPALADWRALLTAANVPLTSFAQGGYLAAKIFVDTLKTIPGEITRQSVTQAFKSLKPVPTPFLGSPYTFGPAATHNPNRSLKIMTLRGGNWLQISTSWVPFPETSR